MTKDVPRITTFVTVFGATNACGGPPQRPEVLVSQVFDPRNLETPSEVSLVDGPGGSSFSARVTFESRGPGWYHVTVGVDGEGVVQDDVLVYQDLSDGPPAFFVDGGCEAQRLSTGAYLCGRTLYRPDGGLETVSGSQAIAAFDVVWTVGNGKVVRWLDSNGALVNTVPDGGYPWSAITSEHVFTATADALVGVHAGQMHWFHRGPAGSLEYASGTYGTVSSTPLTFIGGQTLYVSALRTSTLDAGTQICAWELDGGRILQKRCDTVPGRPLGVGSSGLWVLDGRALKLLGPVDGGVELRPWVSENISLGLSAIEGRKAPTGVPISYDARFSVGPAREPTLAVPVVRHGSVVFVALSGQNGGAAGGLVWATVDSGTRVYAP